MICPSCGHEVDDRLFVDEICVQCVNDLAQYNDSEQIICSDFESSLEDLNAETEPPSIENEI